MIVWQLCVISLSFSRISLTHPQVANPSVSALYEDALVYETGSAMTSTGALTAYSGAKTGRSPLDKRIVQEAGSEKDVWWGPVNKPMSPDVSQKGRDCVFTCFLPESFLFHKIPSFKIAPPASHFVARFGLPRSSRSRSQARVSPPSRATLLPYLGAMPSC
jgi:Phosphoenolpyruvate carboxykinase